MLWRSVAEKATSENFHNEINPRLYRRIGRESRLARYVLDLGYGSCELVQYLVAAGLSSPSPKGRGDFRPDPQGQGSLQCQSQTFCRCVKNL